MIRAGVVGASGYSGAELVRLLVQHPDCGKDGLTMFSSSLTSAFHAGGMRNHRELVKGQHYCDYADFYPAFYGSGLQVYGLPAAGENADSSAWSAFYRAFDVIFLATPHSVSAQLAEIYAQCDRAAQAKQAENSTLQADTLARIIDLSGALRFVDPALYRQWYHEDTAAAEILAQCQYGLSELFADEIAPTRIVANPGCYATSAILALAPLAAGGMLQQVRVDAKSGVSGAGKKVSAAMHFPQTNESLSLYKLHQHQHTPEIEQTLNALARRGRGDGSNAAELALLTFTTHLLPITRGIMATCYIALHPEFAHWDDERLAQLYRQFYQASPFVQVRPVDSENSQCIPQIQDVSFSNRCDIGLRRNPRNGELTVVSVIDNLLKGAAGQAIQNMNLMFGLPQERGLPLVAALP